MSESITWRDVLADAAVRLSDPNEARWLCEHASGLDGAEFVAAFDETPTTAMMASLDRMLSRRLAGEPLQYVMSRWAFRHLDLFVDPRVLIPRPETELIVDHALTALASTTAPRRVVDLGTGSGAIGLAIAAESHPREVEVWLTDVSQDALAVARANVATLGRLGSRVKIAHGSWWNALPTQLAQSIDVAVCNPPYIAPDDPEVSSAVTEWEPHSALFAEDHGLADIRTVIAGAHQWLRVGGVLIFEIGYRQANEVTNDMVAAGFVEVEVWLTDASQDALDVARANVATLGRHGSRVKIAHGSWWNALPTQLAQSIDVAVCNPPYIAPDDPEVSSAVTEWEPHSALFAEDHGLADIRTVIAGANQWLRVGGVLIFEIGYRQAAAVTNDMVAAGFVEVVTHRDLAGRDRFVVGKLSSR